MIIGREDAEPTIEGGKEGVREAEGEGGGGEEAGRAEASREAGLLEKRS